MGDFGDWLNIPSYRLEFTPSEENGEDMSCDVSVRVEDLFEVYPQLARCGESHSEFAEKVVQAAEWNRGLDADTDLFFRLSAPDETDEVAEKRNEKEDF